MKRKLEGEEAFKRDIAEMKVCQGKTAEAQQWDERGSPQATIRRNRKTEKKYLKRSEQIEKLEDMRFFPLLNKVNLVYLNSSEVLCISLPYDFSRGSL